MSFQPSSSKSEGVSKCRYTTSGLSKSAATLQEGITQGTMADDDSTKARAEEDRLMMPPPPQPATRQTRSSPQKGSPRKTDEFTMTLRSQKDKKKGKGKGKGKKKPEPVAASASASASANTNAAETNDNVDSEEPEEDTKESENDNKNQEDDLPPIEPLTEAERLLFPGIRVNSLELGLGFRINDPEPEPTWLFETMTPDEVELWRELAPQAGDRMLTVDEVDKLCDEFYKESRE